MTKRRPQFTEDDWRAVFEIRCRSKRGERISQQDLALCVMAMKIDWPLADHRGLAARRE